MQFLTTPCKEQVVPLYPSLDAGERCPVSILDKYISKLPPDAKEKDLFYVRPLKITDDKLWYNGVPLGKNTLHAKLKMCAKLQKLMVTRPIIACEQCRLFKSDLDTVLWRHYTATRD